MKRPISILIFLAMSIYAKGQFYPLVFNFDTIEPVYIDTTLVGNIWQIGKPQKTIFSSAFNGQNAILTDTINYYPNNNISEFIIKTPTYIATWGGVRFQFYHKFDSDTLIDGGTIDVSYDGIIWENILTSQALNFSWNSFSLTDTISSLNEQGFSGRSSNWQTVYYYWNYPITDTIRIKFKFASDGINNNREGWMIDSLFFFYDLGIGISENKSLGENVFLFPNPSNGDFTIKSSEEILSVEIYNAMGELVKEMKNNSGNSINIRGDAFVNGLYVVRIFGKDNTVSTQRLIIER